MKEPGASSAGQPPLKRGVARPKAIKTESGANDSSGAGNPVAGDKQQKRTRDRLSGESRKAPVVSADVASLFKSSSPTGSSTSSSESRVPSHVVPRRPRTSNDESSSRASKPSRPVGSDSKSGQSRKVKVTPPGSKTTGVQSKATAHYGRLPTSADDAIEADAVNGEIGNNGDGTPDLATPGNDCIAHSNLILGHTVENPVNEFQTSSYVRDMFTEIAPTSGDVTLVPLGSYAPEQNTMRSFSQEQVNSSLLSLGQADGEHSLTNAFTDIDLVDDANSGLPAGVNALGILTSSAVCESDTSDVFGEPRQDLKALQRKDVSVFEISAGQHPNGDAHNCDVGATVAVFNGPEATNSDVAKVFSASVDGFEILSSDTISLPGEQDEGVDSTISSLVRKQINARDSIDDIEGIKAAVNGTRSHSSPLEKTEAIPFCSREIDVCESKILHEDPQDASLSVARPVSVAAADSKVSDTGASAAQDVFPVSTVSTEIVSFEASVYYTPKEGQEAVTENGEPPLRSDPEDLFNRYYDPPGVENADISERMPLSHHVVSREEPNRSLVGVFNHTTSMAESSETVVASEPSGARVGDSISVEQADFAETRDSHVNQLNDQIARPAESKRPTAELFGENFGSELFGAHVNHDPRPAASLFGGEPATHATKSGNRTTKRAPPAAAADLFGSPVAGTAANFFGSKVELHDKPTARTSKTAPKQAADNLFSTSHAITETNSAEAACPKPSAHDLFVSSAPTITTTLGLTSKPPARAADDLFSSINSSSETTSACPHGPKAVKLVAGDLFGGKSSLFDTNTAPLQGASGSQMSSFPVESVGSNSGSGHGHFSQPTPMTELTSKITASATGPTQRQSSTQVVFSIDPPDALSLKGLPASPASRSVSVVKAADDASPFRSAVNKGAGKHGKPSSLDPDSFFSNTIPQDLFKDPNPHHDVFSPGAVASPTSSFDSSAGDVFSQPPPTASFMSPPASKIAHNVQTPTQPKQSTPPVSQGSSFPHKDLQPIPPGHIPLPYGLAPVPAPMPVPQIITTFNPHSAGSSQQLPPCEKPTMSQIPVPAPTPSSYAYAQPSAIGFGQTSIPGVGSGAAPTSQTQTLSTGLRPQRYFPPKNKAVKPQGPVVSFGFGGRLCVMFPKALSFNSFMSVPMPDQPSNTYRPGKVRIMNFTSVCPMVTDRLRELSVCISPTTSQKEVLQVIQRQLERETDPQSSVCVLWRTLRVLVEVGGVLNSEAGVNDPQSPESKIVNLLRATEHHVQVPANASQQSFGVALGGFFGTTARESPVQQAAAAYCVSQAQYEAFLQLQPQDHAVDVSLYVRLESLLLLGRRADAARLCVDTRLWGFALLIASTDKELYAEISKCFADSTFPKNTPLHMLALLYAGQAQSTIEHGGRSLVAPAYGSAPGPDSSLLTSWRDTLAAIIANKTPEWAACVNTLGARLDAEVGDCAAAHMCFVCSGTLPSNILPSASNKSAYTLLNCNFSRSLTPLSDSMMLGVKMTEVLEWCVCKASKDPRKSLSSLLPFRLMFAQSLVDVGLKQEAEGYLSHVREALSVFNVSKSNKSTGQQQRSSGASRPLAPGRACAFNPTDIEELARVLEDRMGLGNQARATGIGKSSAEKTSLWGWVDKTLTSVVNAETPAPASAPGGSGPVSMGSSTHSRPPAFPNADSTFHKSYSTSALDNTAGPPRATTLHPSFIPPPIDTHPTPDSADNKVSKTTPTTKTVTPPNPGGSSIVQSIVGWLPFRNKKQADMGEENTSYYDKDKGEWVFPGQEDEPSAAPLGPPPTGFGPDPTKLAPLNQPQSTDPNDAAFDPLAALIAPPPRSAMGPYGASPPVGLGQGPPSGPPTLGPGPPTGGGLGLGPRPPTSTGSPFAMHSYSNIQGHTPPQSAGPPAFTMFIPSSSHSGSTNVGNGNPYSTSDAHNSTNPNTSFTST